MAEDAIAKARAIAARLSAAAAPSGDVLGKRKSRWGDEESKWGWGDGAGNVHSGGEMRKKKKVYIPVDKYPDINFMGLLIGPRGSNQKRMEEGSGAKILIRGKGSSKDNDPEEECEDLHVEISAPNDESLNKAQELVEEILFNPERAMEIKRQQLRQVAEMNGTLHEGPGSGHGGDPEYESAEITVPRGMVGYVIGRGGETIRDLQSRSGAHVQVVRELEGSNAADRTISVSGSKDAVQRATKMINDLINEKANGSSGGGNTRDGSHYGPGGDPNALLIAVPNEKVGLIIGKGGSTVRALQQRTGANLSIPDSCDPENPSQRVISVSGTEQAKEDAKNEILAIVEDPNQGQSISFPIPNDKVGLVIGRRGDTIRGIQERTQAKINIPPQPDAGSNPPVRTVSVAGSQQAVEMAKYELESILAGNGPSGGGRDNNQRQQYGHGHGYGQGHGHGHGQYHPQQQHQHQHQHQHQQHQQQQYSAYYDANGNPTGYYDQYGQYHYYSQQQQQPHHQQQYYGQEYGQDPNGAASGAVSGTSAPTAVSGAAPDSNTSTATTNAPADGSGAVTTSASATDPNSYWNGYYEYAAYYGVDAANKAWGVAQPATGADSAAGTDPTAGTGTATAPAPVPASEGDSSAPQSAEVAHNSDSAATQEQSTEQSQDQGHGSTTAGSATEPTTTQDQAQSHSQYYAQYGGQYAQGQYGQPQYGQPQYSQGQYAQGQYDQPQHDQGHYGQPQYGQSQYGAQPSGESSETCAPADSEIRPDGANSNPSSVGTSKEPSA